MRLGPDIHGRRHGMSSAQSWAQSYLPLAAPLATLMLLRGVIKGWPVGLGPIAMCVPVAIPKHLVTVSSVVAGYASLLGAMAVTVGIVPTAVCVPRCPVAKLLDCWQTNLHWTTVCRISIAPLCSVEHRCSCASHCRADAT